MHKYKNIKQIADKKNILQKDIAKVLEVTENQMTNYLTGRSKIIADQLPLFAKALRVPISALFGEAYNETDEPKHTYSVSGEKECENCKSKDKTISLLEDNLKRAHGDIDYFKAKYEDCLGQTDHHRETG